MFKFSSDADQATYKTLGSLAKFNGGLFKSAKQAKFVLSERFAWAWSRPSELKNDEMRSERERAALNIYNIRFDSATQTIYNVDAWSQWSELGGRSVRRVAWIFVCDRFGVVAQYKLGFVYNDNERHSSIDPKKTALVFERAADAVLPNLYEEEEKQIAAAQAANAARTFVGKVGERSEFVAKIVSVKEFEGQRFSYYDSGIRTMTVLQDEKGNKLVYWNEIGALGETIRFKATVKSHDEYKGVKQTTLSRAKVLEFIAYDEQMGAAQKDIPIAYGSIGNREEVV